LISLLSFLESRLKMRITTTSQAVQRINHGIGVKTANLLKYMSFTLKLMCQAVKGLGSKNVV